MTKRYSQYSQAELRAKGFAVADEIETRALPLIRAGMNREVAIEKVIEEMGK